VALPGGRCGALQGRTTTLLRLGRMFVCRARIVESHGGRLGDISSTAQESNAIPPPAAVMNAGPCRASRPTSAPSHAEQLPAAIIHSRSAWRIRDRQSAPSTDSDWFRKDDVRALAVKRRTAEGIRQSFFLVQSTSPPPGAPRVNGRLRARSNGA